MERSPIKDGEIKYILKSALTIGNDNCEVYMKEIDLSLILINLQVMFLHFH